MDDFIQSAVSKLGIDESVAKSATGTALGFLKNGMGDQFSQVAEKLPGAEQLIGAAAPEEDSGGGGLLGSITSAASGLLGGGGAGEGVELLGALQNTGLSAEQGGSFITMLLDFIKGKVGEGIMSQITDKIPLLKTITG